MQREQQILTFDKFLLSPLLQEPSQWLKLKDILQYIKIIVSEITRDVKAKMGLFQMERFWGQEVLSM